MISRNGLKRLLLATLVITAFPGAGLQVLAEEGGTDSAAMESKPPQIQSGSTAKIVAPEYKIGEGDVLKFAVWKEPDLSQTVKVSPDGNISLPLISEVHVAGKTTAEIQQVVTTKLKTYLVDPQVNVEVSEVHSRQVFITGEVARPGLYALSTPTTVLQLIAQAGGFSPFAKRKTIVVLRKQGNEQVKLSFNYKEVVKGRNTEENVFLQPGDTVVVP